MKAIMKKTWYASGVGSRVHVRAWAFAIALLVCFAATAEGVLHVSPNAVSGGNGQSWATAVPLEEVPSLVAAGDVVHLMAGTYTVASTLSIAVSVTLRGGFAGTDETELAADPFSRLDGIDTANLLSLKASTKLENIEFVRAKTCAVTSGANGKRLEVVNCRFIGNGTQWAASGTGGRAISWYGDAPWQGVADAGLFVSNCYFAGNAQAVFSGNVCGGAVISVSQLRRAEIYDSTFITNGIAWNYPTGSSLTQYSASAACIDAPDTPLVVIGCDFVANRITSTGTFGMTYRSALIYTGTDRYSGFAGQAKPCFRGTPCISNCLFLANEAAAKSTGQLSCEHEGVVTFYDNLGITCRVDNCTFAYNHLDTKSGTAGLNVYKGEACVRNCIFYGNRIAVAGTQGCDLKLTTNTAKADYDYCLFGGDTVSNIFAVTGASLKPGEYNITADPLFVTPFSDILPLLTVSDSLRNFIKNDVTLATILAADVHVVNQVSKAIDTGDPSYSYALEPSPNGGRINLGRYGGTAEACTTAVAQPEFGGELELTLPYGTTQPRLTFAFGDDGGDYTASVEIQCCTNGVDFFAYKTLSGYGKGDWFDHTFQTAFQSGGTLKVRVMLVAYGAEPRIKVASIALDKPCPSSFGKGGGPGILHVRPGATGDGSGRDWFHALTSCSDLQKAPDFDSASEVWIAGTNIVSATPSAIAFNDITVRGGFVGEENSASERKDGAYAVFDGEGRNVIAFVAACSGAVTFERLEFVRADSCGMTCTYGKAGTDVVFEDCRVMSNGFQRVGDRGSGARGLAVSADSKYAATSTLTLTNCVFIGNGTRANSGQLGDGAMVVGELKRAYFYDCAFVANGVVWTNAVGKNATIAGWGSAALAVSAPATLVGCTFRANRIGSTFDWSEYAMRSAIVSLCGAGNAMTNCLFMGNESVRFVNNNCGQTRSGVLLLSAATEIKNCTFAYNPMSVTSAAAALTILGGDVKVRDAIFFGNLQYPGTAKGADIWLNGTSGTLDIDYTMFEAVDAAHLFANDGCTIATNATSHLYGADPEFVSSTAIFKSLVSRPDDYGWVFPPTIESLSQVSSLNAHLAGSGGYIDEKTGLKVKGAGKTSPCVDAGDPSSPYKCEPRSRGGRVNLGFYGNTPYATCSPPGMAVRVK